MKIIFFSLVTILLTIPITAKKLPLKLVDLEFLVNFEKVKPKFNTSYLTGPCRTIIDDRDNIYICESEKHRVLKFSLKGRLLKQIGRIGQDDEGLYYPTGIFIQDKILYILDDGGKKIKTFTPGGTLLSSSKLRVEGAFLSNAIALHDSKIYTDTRYRVNDWKNKNLISVFSADGTFIRSFGRSSLTERIQAYWIRNQVLIQFMDGQLYGAFVHAPVIFRYTADGKEQLFLDLRTIEIDNDIDAVYDSLHDPDSGENPNKVLSRTYFTGFSVDKNKHFQLMFNESGKRTAIVFILDQTGNSIRKITFKSGGKPVFPVLNIVRGPKETSFIVGCISGSRDMCLFKWQATKNKIGG